MRIPILIEPIEAGRFRARVGEPFGASAEGATAEEAARLVEDLLNERLRNGARLLSVNVSNGKAVSSAAQSFSADDLYQTDWFFRELQEAIIENRRLEDEAEKTASENEGP